MMTVGSMKASILALYLGMTPVKFHWSLVTFFSIRAAVDMMILRMASRSMTLPLKDSRLSEPLYPKVAPGVHHDVGDPLIKKLCHDGLEVVSRLESCR